MCPKCQKKLRAPSNLAGQKLVCPKCSSPIRVPGVVETKSDDDDWLSLNSPDEPAIIPTPEKRSITVTKSPKTAGRSVFDDDLPELLPAYEPPVAIPATPPAVPSKPKLKSSQASNTSLKPELVLPDIPLPELDFADIPLAPFENETLSGPTALMDNEEISFHCKVCGSLLNSSRSQIGTETSCPDCYSKFRVPNSPPKKKPSEVKLDAELASVTFAPIDSLSVHGTNNPSEKTKEILDRAEQTLEMERDEFDHLNGTFDTKQWMGFLFGFLRDPLVIVAAIGIGVITGVWFIAMAGTQVFILRLAILVLFCVPIAGLICMCGLAVLTMAANRASRVIEWPFRRLSESIGECAIVMASIMVASIPGGILGVGLSSLNAHPMVALAFVLIGIWGLTPILLLSMINNNSIFEPYSKAVLNSIKSHPEAWGAMYMQTAAALVLFFLMMVMLSMQGLVGNFLSGLTLPFACFFVFNQYGVLAGRISHVTEIGFEGDFSED